MAISAEKVAPSAIVLAFVGYCVWPSLSGMLMESSKPKPPEKVEGISKELLSPAVSPLPTRNPWGGKDAATMAALRKAEEEEARRKEEKALAVAQEAIDNAEDPTANKAANPLDTLKGLTLAGTCIGGGQSFAIINDHTYALNQFLPNSETGGVKLKLIEVSPHKVLLEYRGKPFELKYKDLLMYDATVPDDQKTITANESGWHSGGEDGSATQRDQVEAK